METNENAYQKLAGNGRKLKSNNDHNIIGKNTVILKLPCTAVNFQIKNSLAKAFSRRKNGARKSDSGMTVDSDNMSILSDISLADAAGECLQTPVVRTADWFVQHFT